MRRLVIAAMLMGCGGSEMAGDAGADAACGSAERCLAAGEDDVPESYFGEWVLVGDLRAPDPGGPDAGFACPATVEMRVCITDYHAAEALMGGHRLPVEIGDPGINGHPNLGPARFGDALVCNAFVQEGVKFSFTTCDCVAEYVWRAPTHDPIDCPSFP